MFLGDSPPKEKEKGGEEKAEEEEEEEEEEEVVFPGWPFPRLCGQAAALAWTWRGGTELRRVCVWVS